MLAGVGRYVAWMSRPPSESVEEARDRRRRERVVSRLKRDKKDIYRVFKDDVRAEVRDVLADDLAAALDALRETK